MDNKGFELLLVKDLGEYWQVEGITYSNAMQIEPSCSLLRATLFTIEECKKYLAEGKRITISKVQEYSEVQPKDLVIEAQSELDRVKLMALNEVVSRMHLTLITVSVIDLMEYLNNYVTLLNAGYYITDANREDKYFEVIESSLEFLEPEPLKEDATIEQEQDYIQKKQQYDTALFNLSTLEKYLNSYDKLSHIKMMTDFLTNTRDEILNAKSIEDVLLLMKISRSNLLNYKMVN